MIILASEEGTKRGNVVIDWNNIVVKSFAPKVENVVPGIKSDGWEERWQGKLIKWPKS